MILLTPEDANEKIMMWEANCTNVEAAQQQATNRIVNNFNL